MARQAAGQVVKHRRQGRSYWMYEHEYADSSELLERLDAMLREDRRLQVTSMILICKEDMFAGMDRWAGLPLPAEVLRVDRGAGMASVSIGGGGNAGGQGRVRFVKMQDPFVYLAVTDGDAAFVDLALGPFIKSLYPDVSEAALSSAEMRKALGALEQASGGAVRIVGMDACPEQYIEGGGSDADGEEERQRPPTACADVPYREAFDEAARSGRRVGAVRALLVLGGSPRMECHISRRCLSRFRLSMRPFCEGALPYMAGLASDKTRFYSGRSRKENGGRFRALAITLDDGAFGDAFENVRFMRIIRAMPRTMGSTYRQTPHVHMSLVDYMDGSSFDVWATSTNRITIVPQLRATHAAVARLVNHIFERFGEGRVEEYDEE